MNLDLNFRTLQSWKHSISIIPFLGEVLSKQHLQLNNTIKKLRSKLSDRESTVKDLNENIDKLKEENKTLKSVNINVK